MKRYLIELSHEDEHYACVRALRAIERHGSHFITRAEWGCRSGVHSGWLLIDVSSRDEALQLVPPELRADARVVEVGRFSGEEIAAILAEDPD